MFYRLLLAGFAGSAAAGTVLWDGRFNASTASDLEAWSWSNQEGAYQYYIHGSGNLTDYVNLSSDYKNPADTASSEGAKLTIDSTSQWNSDGMLRTELIPQTDAAINEGTVYYHFSVMHNGDNVPNAGYEHQVCFFESHFTELKYGLISGESGSTDTQLQWYANSESQWSVNFTANVWHNVAYEIDFDGGSVTYYHSTGSDDLTKVAGPVTVSASSNGADWHLGVLRLDGTTDATTEDWYFSGVYIESGDLTTAVSGGSSSSSGTTTASSAVSSVAAAATSAQSSTGAPTSTSATVVQEATSVAAPASYSTTTSVASSPSSTEAAIDSTSAVATSAISTAVATSSAVVVSSPATVSTSAAVVSTPSSVPTTLATVTRSSTTSVSTPSSVAGSDSGTTSSGESDDSVRETFWELYQIVVEWVKWLNTNSN